MKEISSRDNQLFRHALSLKKKKYRDQYGEYLIEGPNLIKEAIKEGVEIRTLLLAIGRETGGNDMEILEEDSLKDRTCVLSGNLFKELSETETPQGMMAVVSKRRQDDPAEAISPGGNIVVLDRVQDPGNIGTILRTADAAGFDVACFIKGTGDPYSSKIIRSAAGSLFRLPILFVSDYDELVELMRRNGKRIIATAMESDTAYYDADLSHDCAIVIGNEGNGVAPELLKR
ncbi:MAG: RNA methyltransferase, partial [Firmicutes bacterium]|nr:RNA methyltransferase [Bacillota bacterium]